MSPTSNRVEASKRELLRTLLEDGPTEVLAVGTDEATTEALLEALGDLEDAPKVRLLAADPVLKWLRNDFVLASTAAELVEDDVLELRTTDDRSGNRLLVTDDWLVSLVPAGRYTAGLTTDDAEFVADAREYWRENWERGGEFDLRTPARSRVVESLTAEFGPEVEADFRTMVDAVRTARGDGSDGLDEVGASLLAAAKHEALLYDVSKWGEEVGLASKATFSRMKTTLEERGLIETEKVPIDVGRPRLRLLLADDRFEGASAEEIASGAHGSLSRTRS